jgi:exosortase/archaeosortase family protein
LRRRNGKVYLSNTPGTRILFLKNSPAGSFEARPFLLLALTLTLAAIAADQFAAPILHSTSPLWATAAWLLLALRRSEFPRVRDDPSKLPLSPGRLASFLLAHLGLILVSRAMLGTFQPVAGTTTSGGTFLAVWKLCVLAPTILLLPLPGWKVLLRTFRAELVAALVVLFTFFPRRVLESLWPWYGQALSRLVFLLASPLAPGLGYVKDLAPTVTGPNLDVTIILACSGINGLELFDYLFAFVALLDWNRLRKRRMLLAYFSGLLAMLLANTLRLTTIVVLGNHGYADIVSRFHISAGWVFFCAMFLLYISLIYSWMLHKKRPSPEKPKVPSA